MQSGQTNSGGDVDLFGQDHQQQQPKPTESNETFDPFGSGGGQAQGDDDDEDWAGFESAKPTSAAKPEVDLFGQISSQPQPQSGAQQAGFDAFQSPAQPQNSGGNAVDLLGAAPMQAAPSGMGGLDLLSATPPQPAPSSMPLNQQMLYTGSSAPVQQTTTAAPQQAQQGGSAKGDALWGSGLVDLGNLSLNSSKPSGSVPQMQTQPTRSATRESTYGPAHDAVSSADGSHPRDGTHAAYGATDAADGSPWTRDDEYERHAAEPYGWKQYAGRIPNEYAAVVCEREEPECSGRPLPVIKVCVCANSSKRAGDWMKFQVSSLA